ncbi:MAG TPA: class II aldolase/adducin family protein, partial [Anaerolineae bacterium]|nr:class II aldolase/adducin family protein [Anaerolineae bacterium]
RPVLLLRNDAILTAGQSVLQAFDRLEIAEFSAKSLIDAQALGEFSPLGKQEIAEINKKFQLS